MTEIKDTIAGDKVTKKSYGAPTLKVYRTPELTKFGDLRDVSKGQAAYSANEGFYENFAMS